jgi:hypothetical protein
MIAESPLFPAHGAYLFIVIVIIVVIVVVVLLH